VIICCVQCYA